MDDAYHLIGSVRRNSQERLQVALSEYRGSPFIDVRIFADLGDGEPQPTRKGITVRPDRLADLIDTLEDARAEAERRGLIGGRA